MKIVITGGHHSSALPVISLMKKEHPEVELFWFGHRYSVLGNKADTLEYIEITGLGIPFFDIKAGKFYKTRNIIRLLRIPYGFFQTLFLLLKVRPNLILSFGGYLAVPTVMAGWFLGIPSVTHEQTVVVGYANKLISKFTKKVMISWEESAKFFQEKKTVYTGIPLRPSLFEVKSNSFVFGNDLPVVYVTAGKTGSHLVNKVVEKSLEELLEFCNVIHQCGDHSELKDFERLSEKFSSTNHMTSYIARKFVFEDEIGEVFSKADVIVSRSGAHTIRELLAFKKSCVLIPIPWVSHNEQYENAKLLEERELAIVLDERELTSDVLINAIKEQIVKALKAEKFTPQFDDTPARKILETALLYAKS
ncbi:MAG: glycosyltransferase [Patescibacteria group bacterium]|jgi:UDP-N-acetylglucosamine--N-acetylmuramyl-(pentapeptide) pyrophosphoryl-undecaprenol N-acetylglucosamine transferase